MSWNRLQKLFQSVMQLFEWLCTIRLSIKWSMFRCFLIADLVLYLWLSPQCLRVEKIFESFSICSVWLMKRQVSRHAISENFDICIFLYNPVDTEENGGRGWGGGGGGGGPLDLSWYSFVVCSYLLNFCRQWHLCKLLILEGLSTHLFRLVFPSLTSAKMRVGVHLDPTTTPQ